jgi:hypothetical protein
MHLANALSEEYQGMPRITWPPNQRSHFHIDGQKFSFPVYRTFIGELLGQAHDLFMSKLLLGLDFTELIASLPTEFKDPLTCDDSGYSFLTDPANSDWCDKAKHSLWQKILASPEYCSHFHHGVRQADKVIDWNAVTCRSYLDICDDYLVNYLFPLTHLLASHPARGTEHELTQVTNLPDSLRSIFFIEGFVCIILHHNKTSNATGDKLILRVPPAALGRDLLLFLAIVRPFITSLLARFGTESVQEDHSTWLWVTSKKRLKSDDFSRALHRFFSDGLNISMNQSTWRQCAAAIQDRFHVPDVDKYGPFQPAFSPHLAAGHAHGTVRGNYGIDTNQLRNLTWENINEFFKVSSLLHFPFPFL